jgi:GTPase SAR1 family protein
LKHYYKNTQVLIFVVDSNDRDRLADVKYEIDRSLSEDELNDTIVLIMANKQDLPNCLSVHEIRQCLELDRYSNRKVNIIGTVATTGLGFDDSFEWISSQLLLKNIKAPISETINDWASIFNHKNNLYRYFSDFYQKIVTSDDLKTKSIN